jgi:hypothetical protein
MLVAKHPTRHRIASEEVSIPCAYMWDHGFDQIVDFSILFFVPGY